jgi:hypothetical protein
MIATLVTIVGAGALTTTGAAATATGLGAGLTGSTAIAAGGEAGAVSDDEQQLPAPFPIAMQQKSE